MGKDTKIIWTKDGLKSENIKLSRRLRELDMSYRDVHSIFTQLERDYDNSYGVFPFQRYSMLKGMIKHAASAENLDKVEALMAKDEQSGKKHKTSISGLLEKAKGLAGGEENAPKTNLTSSTGNKGMGGLLAACKKYAGKDENVEANESKKKDLSEMCKKEVTQDNELKRAQIEEYDVKFLHAYNYLEKLKADYSSSKGRFPLVRYGTMKAMVKEATKFKDDR